MQLIINYIYENPYEVIGVLTSALYSIGAVAQNRYAMIASIIGSSMFFYVYFSSKLYYESLLYLYYVVIAIYGLIIWSSNTDGSKKLSISTLGYKKNAYIILISLFFTLFFAYLARHTDNASSFLDSLIFVYSIPATYIQIKKYLENWIYWIVLNLISAFLMFHIGLYFMFVFMLFLTIIAIFGFIKWYKINYYVANIKI